MTWGKILTPAPWVGCHRGILRPPHCELARQKAVSEQLGGSGLGHCQQNVTQPPALGHKVTPLCWLPGLRAHIETSGQNFCVFTYRKLAKHLSKYSFFTSSGYLKSFLASSVLSTSSFLPNMLFMTLIYHDEEMKSTMVSFQNQTLIWNMCVIFKIKYTSQVSSCLKHMYAVIL